MFYSQMRGVWSVNTVFMIKVAVPCRVPTFVEFCGCSLWTCSFSISPAFAFLQQRTLYFPRSSKSKKSSHRIWICFFFISCLPLVKWGDRFGCFEDKTSWRFKGTRSPLIKITQTQRSLRNPATRSQLAVPWWEVCLSGLKDSPCSDVDLPSLRSYL